MFGKVRVRLYLIDVTHFQAIFPMCKTLSDVKCDSLNEKSTMYYYSKVFFSFHGIHTQIPFVSS